MGQGARDTGQGKEVLVERAKEFLKAAEMVLDANCHHAAALCAYAAMFWAAIAILALFDVNRKGWSHSDLKDAFRDELVRKRQIYPDKFVLWLADGYKLRCDAHYNPVIVPIKKVRRLVAHAKEFVELLMKIWSLYNL